MFLSILYEITLKGGKKYYATPEHEWPIWNGSSYEKISTDRLIEGQYLPVLKQQELFIGDVGTEEEGFLVGWNIGDGWVCINEGKNSNIGFIFAPQDIEYGISGKILNYIKQETGAEINGSLDSSNCLEYTTNSKYLNELFKTKPFLFQIKNTSLVVLDYNNRLSKY